MNSNFCESRGTDKLCIGKQYRVNLDMVGSTSVLFEYPTRSPPFKVEVQLLGNTIFYGNFAYANLCHVYFLVVLGYSYTYISGIVWIGQSAFLWVGDDIIQYFYSVTKDSM